MSKEMTPKDAFQSLVEIYDITKSSKQCKIINKALNSVEETKTNYHTALAFCEASKEEKQELHKQIEQLEKENQALRDKLNINFEDCADELCEALIQRDKLYDENLELKKEIENKDKAFEILNNLCESQTKVIGKYEKVIDILKKKKVNVFHIWVFDTYEQYKEHYPFAEYYASEDMLTKDEFTFLKEFLG